MMRFRAGDKGRHYPSLDVLYIREGIWYQTDIVSFVTKDTVDAAYLFMHTRLLPLTHGTSPINIKIY